MRGLHRARAEEGLTVPLVFLVSIGVSFVSVTAAELFWFLAFLVRPALRGVLSIMLGFYSPECVEGLFPEVCL